MTRRRGRASARKGKAQHVTTDPLIALRANAMVAAIESLDGRLAPCRIVFMREPVHATVATVETSDHRIGVGRADLDGHRDAAVVSPAFQQDVLQRLALEFPAYGKPFLAAT